jgi:predicted secreted protein
MRTFPFWALLLTACSYTKVEHEKGSGIPNKIKKGSKFCVSLPEDHSTKYLWTLKKDIPTLRVDYMGSVFHGTYVDFNFTAVGRGSEELTFYLYCAKDTQQVKTFVVEVE